MRKEKRKAVFLDRDGVINRKAPEGDYIKSWDEFEFLPGVKEAIKKLNERGFLVIIVSNQRGIAKGVMTENDLKEIHSRMKSELKSVGAKVDDIYYCPHDVGDNCNCRKPKPGLLLKAAKEWDIELSRSWMIGDQAPDIEAGKRAGCKTILIKDDLTTSNDADLNKIKADLITTSLAEAVDKLLNHE